MTGCEQWSSNFVRWKLICKSICRRIASTYFWHQRNTICHKNIIFLRARDDYDYDCCSTWCGGSRAQTISRFSLKNSLHKFGFSGKYVHLYNSFSPISIFRPIIQSKAFWTWKDTVEDCFMCCGLEWYPIHSLDTFRLLACSCVWGTEGYIWAKLLGLASYSQLIFIGSLCPWCLSFVFGCLSVYWWCCVDLIHVSQVLP